MPWKESSVMDERLQFVARRLAGELASGPQVTVRSVTHAAGPDRLQMVGAEGFEPPTLCSQSRSNDLSKPIEICDF